MPLAFPRPRPVQRPTVRPLAPSGAATSLIPLETPSDTIVSGGVTYTLNQTVDYFLVDGWPVVIDPGGLTIVSRSPAAATVGSDAVNGTVKNPARLTSAVPTASQGWDQRMQGSSYSAALNAGFPISVAAGDVVVGAVHEPSPSAFSGITAPVREYCPIYFANARKPVGAVLPSAVTWAGRSGLTWRHFDAAAVIASWGSTAQRSTSGMTLPSYAAVLDILARFEVSWGRNYSASDGGYESETTYRGAATYGQTQAQWIGAAGLYLISDAITDEQKATLLRHLVRLGLHAWEPAAGQGDAPVKGNGGHWQFDFIPKVLALNCLGLSSDLDNLHTVHPGNVLTQPFVHTSGTIADLAPHSSATKPYPYLLRTISAVSGTTITVPAGAGDPAQVGGFVGLRLKRQSDGATATVTAAVNNGSTYDLTIDVQPGSPFAVGNSVYCESIDPIRVGDADWQISGSAWWEHYSPSYSASYRPLSKWTEEILVPRALGIWRTAWDAAESYTVRANRANDPSSARDFASGHDTCDGVAMAAQFWAAHAASILTGKPQFLALPTISGTGEVGSTLTATIGTMAGDATITHGSYQWMLDGVDVPGATSANYVPVSGDIGKVPSFRVTASNGAGSTTIYSEPGTAIVSAFAANGVSFPSTSNVTNTSMPSVAAGKAMTAVFFVRIPTTWPTAAPLVDFLTSGGTQKLVIKTASSGRMSVQSVDTGITHTTPSSTFAADTGPTGAYYLVGVSIDTRAGQRLAQFRVGATVATMSGFAGLADDTDLWPALGRWRVNNSGVALDMAEVFVDLTTALDLSDSAVWAKFAATASRGANGSIPTGAQPVLYLSGDASTFGTNKGSGGGGTVTNGPLTNSAYDPA